MKKITFEFSIIAYFLLLFVLKSYAQEEKKIIITSKQTAHKESKLVKSIVLTENTGEPGYYLVEYCEASSSINTLLYKFNGCIPMGNNKVGNNYYFSLSGVQSVIGALQSSLYQNFLTLTFVSFLGSSITGGLVEVLAIASNISTIYAVDAAFATEMYNLFISNVSDPYLKGMAIDEAKKIGERSIILLEKNIDIEKLRNDMNWLLQVAVNDEYALNYTVTFREKKANGFFLDFKIVNSLNEFPPQTGFAPH